MLYLYKFDVKYCNEDAGHDSIIRGIVAGHTYNEAFDAAVEYVGEENIIKIQLELIEDTEGGLLVQDIIPNPTNQ